MADVLRALGWIGLVIGIFAIFWAITHAQPQRNYGPRRPRKTGF